MSVHDVGQHLYASRPEMPTVSFVVPKIRQDTMVTRRGAKIKCSPRPLERCGLVVLSADELRRIYGKLSRGVFVYSKRC